MDPLNLVLSIIGAISLVTFIALFGHIPGLRNTPVGWVQRFLLRTLPRLIRKLDYAITGGCCISSMGRCGDYLMNEKHPLVLVFYLVLVTGGLGIFIHTGWRSLPLCHRILVPLVSCGPYIGMYYASTSDPGFITHMNHSHAMRIYPYDRINFQPGVACRTCHFYKPARSKHCNICKGCIAKQDHHCVWINNCVGHNNTRHFLAFLMFTNIFLTYGSYLTYDIMNMYIQSLLPRGKSVSDIPWSLYLKGWGIGFLNETALAAIFLLCVVSSILSYSFTAYHLYLIWAGTTTNETFKWTDWADDIRTGGLYIATATTRLYTPHAPQPLPGNEGSVRPGLNDEEIHNQTEPHVLWPKEARQVLARVPVGGDPGRLPKGLTWKRCEGLSEVENIYDLGWKENLKLVVWPRRM